MTRLVSAFLICFVLIGMVACGGGSSTPPPTPTPVTAAITITPVAPSVIIGGSQTFTPTVNGATVTGVTWSTNGPGTIDAQRGVYLAPTTFPGSGANTATIKATLGNQSGTTTATVVYQNRHQDFQSGPIKFGTEGGNVNDVNNAPPPNGGCCVGTLGSLISRGGNLFILSNNHVLDESDNGTNGQLINQPGPTLCFAPNKTVGNLVAPAPSIRPTAGSDPVGCKGSTAPVCGAAPSNVDAAIAAPTVGEVDTTGSILDFGTAGPTSIGDLPPSATPFQGLPVGGQPVAKSGRTSGLTCSTVQSIGGPFRISYFASCGGAVAFDATYQNQIVVNGGNFIQPGDSGSLLVTSDTARALGLLFASDGQTSSIANPIGDVFKALTSGANAPTLVGGSDHAVSCAPMQSVASTQIPSKGAASSLMPGQKQIVAAVRDRNARVLMTDPAIKSVEVGASADNPMEGALVITVSGATKSAIPVTIEGVRTRVVTLGQTGLPPITQDMVKSSIAILHDHQDSYMAKAGIQGMGVGRSDDNPAETAIVIYTVKGVRHEPIPAVIDGIRTKIIEAGRFYAY